MLRITLMFGLVVVLLATGIPGFCQSTPVAYPANQPASLSGFRQCSPSPQQPVQPVARSVQVTVPVPAAPERCRPPAPFPPHPCAPPAPPAAAPPRTMPVRVEVSVRPEAHDQQRLVPVFYPDPGFMGPIVSHSFGLVGATIAAPFRVAEMLIPLASPPCRPMPKCGPPPSAMNCGFQRPAPPSFVPQCPVPVTRPASTCVPGIACAPPGPSMAPLPPAAGPAPCQPFIPPALVEREEEPPCAPQSLLGGLVSLPSSVLERGRFMGDIGSTSENRGAWNR
jgi:hypothetical protein